MELHDALTDLADTVTDDPHRLASVHARYRRHRRTRVVVAATSTAAVVCAAVLVGALASVPSSSRGPHHDVATSPIWVDVATSSGAQSPVAPKSPLGPKSPVIPKVAQPACPRIPAPSAGSMQPATSPPAITPPEPLSPPTWTGAPPPLGAPFSLNGTVTAATNESFTITASDGTSEGTFTFPNECDPQREVVGTQAHVAGTRTGPDTYNFSSLAVQVYSNS